MCIACRDFQKGDLTFNEYSKNRGEFSEDVEHEISEDEHIHLTVQNLFGEKE